MPLANLRARAPPPSPFSSSQQGQALLETKTLDEIAEVLDRFEQLHMTVDRRR